MTFIDFLLIGLVIVGILVGLFKGLIKILIALGSLYLSIILASLYYTWLATLMAKNSTTSFALLEVLAFLTVLIISFVLLFWVGLYTFRYVRLPGRLQFLDRLGGTMLGLLFGAFLACILVMMMRYLFENPSAVATFDYPVMRFLRDSTKESVLKELFVQAILPVLYGPISPILPNSANRIFTRLNQ